jgi:hypothetical protein
MKKIRKPDVKNENPKYWEKVLESHGLGLKQLGLDEKPRQDPNLAPLEEADDE